jgi:hypothetical protein
MPSRQVLPWLLLALFTGACASSPKSAEQRPEPPPPLILFKSPLTLLLEHHEELLLNTDQMIAVGRLNEALQEKNKMLRMKVRELRPRGPPPARSGGSGMNVPPGVDASTYNGTRRQSPFDGMGGPPVPEVPPETEEQRKQRQEQLRAILREMEGNEDAAYAEAEKVLDEKQKMRGQELVAQQREARRKAREAMQSPTPPSEGEPPSEAAPEPAPASGG